MNMYDAVMIAEGVEDASMDERQQAWQTLIDTGLVWQLQGWFGRTAMFLIDEGICTPPPGWGNPSKADMEARHG